MSVNLTQSQQASLAYLRSRMAAELQDRKLTDSFKNREKIVKECDPTLGKPDNEISQRMLELRNFMYRHGQI